MPVTDSELDIAFIAQEIGLWESKRAVKTTEQFSLSNPEKRAAQVSAIHRSDQMKAVDNFQPATGKAVDKQGKNVFVRTDQWKNKDPDIPFVQSRSELITAAFFESLFPDENPFPQVIGWGEGSVQGEVLALMPPNKFEEAKAISVVVEFVEPGSLAETRYIDWSNSSSVARTFNFLIQYARLQACAEEYGIVFNDLKDQTTDSAGKIKFLDYGFPMAVNEAGEKLLKACGLEIQTYRKFEAIGHARRYLAGNPLLRVLGDTTGQWDKATKTLLESRSEEFQKWFEGLWLGTRDEEELAKISPDIASKATKIKTYEELAKVLEEGKQILTKDINEFPRGNAGQIMQLKQQVNVFYDSDL